MIDREHKLSVLRQAKLLGFSRGSVYYSPHQRRQRRRRSTMVSSRHSFGGITVPLAIAAEPPEPVNRLPLPKLACDGPRVQVLTLRIGADVVMRDVPVERVAALVRAVRGAS